MNTKLHVLLGVILWLAGVVLGTIALHGASHWAGASAWALGLAVIGVIVGIFARAGAVAILVVFGLALTLALLACGALGLAAAGALSVAGGVIAGVAIASSEGYARIAR